MIPVRFVRLHETETYDNAELHALPREGESVYFGDQHGTFKVARVLHEPYYSDGYNDHLGRVTVVIYQDS